jgi:hypothetical protein
MGTIVPFLNGAAFEPQDIDAMSMTLDDVCRELKINGGGSAREIIAIRIIELANQSDRIPLDNFVNPAVHNRDGSPSTTR